MKTEIKWLTCVYYFGTVRIYISKFGNFDKFTLKNLDQMNQLWSLDVILYIWIYYSVV